MTRARLLLHAGLHKTGTTAIQAFASRNRGELRRRGVWYPGYEPVRSVDHQSHNRLAHSFAQTGKRGLLSAQEIESLVDYWQTQGSDETILISAEAFSRHVLTDEHNDWLSQRVMYLRHVAESLNAFEVDAVLVLRRQDEYVHSTYLEHVMKGTKEGALSFEEFRQRLGDLHLQYEKNLMAFESCFDRIHVMLYEDLRRDPRFCANFFSGIGFDVSDLQEPGIVRKSLSPAQANVKKSVRWMAVSKGMNRGLNASLRSGVGEWLAHRLGKAGDAGLWKSDAERRQWQDRYAEENERIRRRFFPEREVLFENDEKN